MKRRLVLALTAASILLGGAGVASAADRGLSPGVTTPKQHQFCVILYNEDGSIWRYYCLNW
jgi:hypothetical protein